MSEPLVIPEDLQEEYAEVCDIVVGFDNGPDFMRDWDTKAWAGNALATKQHIERIARAETENAALRDKVERLGAPVSEEEIVLVMGNAQDTTSMTMARVCREIADKIIAARSKP